MCSSSLVKEKQDTVIKSLTALGVQFQQIVKGVDFPL